MDSQLTVVEEASANNTNGTEYIAVAENENSECIELPLLPEDGSLSLNTLTHTFPGAHGLKFKNPTTGACRALLMDSQGSRFLAPSGGWSDKTFFVIYPSRGAGDQNAKRRKMMDECEQESDSDDSQGGHGGHFTSKQKRMEDPNEKICIDLIVLGLPFKTTAESCKAYFETFGEVILFDLKMDQSGTSKGFGFVRMADYEAQQRVLAKQVHEIDGRRCQVKIPLSKSEANQSFVSRIFVGRLQEKVTVDELRKFFNDEAAKIDVNACVTDVFIPRPFRSFAFVNFSSPTVAKEMIKQGDFVIDGSSVAVSAAAPREADYSTRYGRNDVFPVHPGASISRRITGLERYGNFTSDTQAGYNFDRPTDNWRGGAYRAGDTRGSNRFTPGYTNSPRYNSAGRTGTSQALASGLDALSLNKMNVNPDMMDAAWQAFWSTLNSAGSQTAGAQNANSSNSQSAKW